MTVAPAFDPSTGEVFPDAAAARIRELEAQVADLRERLDVKDNALEDANWRLGRKRRDEKLDAAEQNRRIKADRELDRHWQDAYRVFERWRERVAPNAREFGEKRWAAVRARLNADYTVDDLFWAIEGAATLPKSMKASQRDAMRELEWIARNEKNMDLLMRSATQFEFAELKRGRKRCWDWLHEHSPGYINLCKRPA